ncbi:TrkH family potassium uptake protein [Nitrosomonas eutropha]|uniref:Trk system potassium uptake protein n=3 Tax=Nitrosomonadaceae TaxID=206379 RepID=A0ABX5MAL2_9PROT|nr:MULTISPECIES: potassium transporter TrkG [Nitrosomonas]ABI59386.1 cation transporter [Nitrosomonas eutropha C91]MXS79428.1 TrkH family potassium uptake protein [Nitrosomonas sp. GH22]PXV83267.1 trk system potassium uptake protein TrkH [Nitrosomonas eutropha]SCX09258.1 trk system potassium uptake protein TrkH [Nitrosomonas eutropha]SDV99304.1 trk system potassium uptake protein TrkH [Nitrosomonas eutropha]
MFGLVLLIPCGVAYWMKDGSLPVFLETLFITLGCGVTIWLLTYQFKRELQIRDGFLLVVLVWLSLPVFGMLPLFFYFPELGVAKSYFEAASGLTSTGATVLMGLDEFPYAINLWRCLMAWIGGMGLIVLAVAILPMLGVGGRKLFSAEIPGPIKESRLTPRIAETAKRLWLIYAALTVACTIAYWLAGMTTLDAIAHALSTLGLGGFSTHDASYGYWDSPLIEAIAILFMLIAGINFSAHFVAWRARNFSAYRADPEAKLYILITLSSCIGITGFLWTKGIYTDPLVALRYAAFNVVSVATTTGYSNTDYALWPIFAPLWMLFLSGFCTSSGSTGGGIKMIRARILFQQFFREMIIIMHPRAVSLVKIGKNIVANEIIFAILAFLFVYLTSIVLMTLALTLSGLDEITAFSAAVACLNNLGAGLGKIGPSMNYASLNDFQIWLCSFAMFLGRLEFYTLMIVFTPAFWRK